MPGLKNGGIPSWERAARIHPPPVPGTPNLSSRNKQQMHRPVTISTMSNKIKHTEDTGDLIRPLGQIPTHHAEPSPHCVKSWVHTNRTIQQVDNRCVSKAHLTGPDRPHNSSSKGTEGGSRNMRRLSSMYPSKQIPTTHQAQLNPEPQRQRTSRSNTMRLERVPALALQVMSR